MGMQGLTAPPFKLRDSCTFTPEGRALLVSLGVVEPDPLLVEAESWLLEREAELGDTAATKAVRAELEISPWPAEWLDAAERMRRTPWKGPVA
jgi:hypothetical protein